MARNATKRVINNAPYYNDSLAHDFAMFMPKEKKKTNNVVKYKPTKMHKRRFRYNVDKVTVCVGVLCFGLIILSLFVRVQTCELNAHLKHFKTEATALDAEKVALIYEYEGLISYTNLEQAAVELGMRKLTHEQVVYIRTNAEDKAILKNGETVIAEKK